MFLESARDAPTAQCSSLVGWFIVVGSEELIQFAVPFVAVAPLEVLFTPLIDALSHDGRIRPPIDPAKKPSPDEVQQLPYHAEPLG